MQILIVGGGGREHALAWKVAQSLHVNKVWVAPGNAGTARENKVQNVPIQANNIHDLIEFAQRNQVDLTIVGPETPLAAGIVNQFQNLGLLCFGPTQEAFQLEASKSFCKKFLDDNQIPTAQYETFNSMPLAIKYIEQQTFPVVIKADGLAGGKGVFISENRDQAIEAINTIFKEKKFGAAGNCVVIEEFLSGEELSFIVISDGKNILPLASAQDHKRRDDGDKGPNTGGMGAYSPAPILTPTLDAQIMQKIIRPTIAAMHQRGTPYCGFLYAGLMISPQGEAKVLEYNCRLGDPEAQPILMRMQTDLVDVCLAALQGKLNQIDCQWDPQTALTVVLSADGYPEQYRQGDIIEGLDLADTTDCKVFHSGTQLENQKIVARGGRVLSVTALGNDIYSAHKKAYDRVKKIHWPKYHYRTDIGHHALQK